MNPSPLPRPVAVPPCSPDFALPRPAARAAWRRRLATLALALAATGCAPLLVGGVVGGALVAADRRPLGIQVEDEAIERRINRAIAERYPQGPLNVDVFSYNRRVLLTGEVPTEAARAEIEASARAAENVREVVADLIVGPVSTMGSRSSDTLVGGKVRAALLDTQGLPPGVVSVRTTRGKVYLLGRVSAEEAELAARSVSRVSGVVQVVKVFEILAPEEHRAVAGPPPQPVR